MEPVKLSPSSQSVILSVVIPCYNQGEYLLEAIASVEACLDPVYEIVIVNDGSTNLVTLSVVHYLEEQGYFVLNQENQGLASARNNGIEKSKGRYILPLDADNKIRSDYISKGIEVLDRNPDVGVVYGKPEWFGEGQRSWDIPEKFDAGRLPLGNYIDACTVLRKSLWEDCGGYDVNMPVPGWEDWDLWLSAIEKGWKFHYIPEVLFDYRVRADSMAIACALPENRGRLMHYICLKHARLYLTRFPEMIRDREEQIGNLLAHIGHLETERSGLLGQVQSETAHSSSLLAQMQELEIDRGSLLAQMQELDVDCSSPLAQMQESKQRVSFKSEADQLQLQIEQTQAQLEMAQTTIAAMQSSKFWKLRKAWLSLRGAFRL